MERTETKKTKEKSDNYLRKALRRNDFSLEGFWMIVSHKNFTSQKVGLKPKGEFGSGPTEQQQPFRPRNVYLCPGCGSGRVNRNGFFVSADDFNAATTTLSSTKQSILRKVS